MTRWQELVETNWQEFDHDDVYSCVIHALHGLDDPADAVMCLHRLISKIDQVADAINKVAARESVQQFASSAAAFKAVTGEL